MTESYTRRPVGHETSFATKRSVIAGAAAAIVLGACAVEPAYEGVERGENVLIEPGSIVQVEVRDPQDPNAVHVEVCPEDTSPHPSNSVLADGCAIVSVNESTLADSTEGVADPAHYKFDVTNGQMISIKPGVTVNGQLVL